ncbi:MULTISPECIES: ABC transporter substrate-binding protein [unclassified Saccharopolyspora]|uniref:ABC transporter substrate-binding protein n=1 Tax=unclassified Saccharopolyspora TaxID=2646250 RepID=UPI001CD4FE0B|nr:MULTISPECIES: ABC transporter substrate-binding protein [unclassified Saccharopolyspora]MCA1186418.1 ABC transporter substrate-binding protein [Saccharopolyspora sp. 6T]MCA1227523.1 ABC transporter substrate-binding protein [Saccharopolyspora sp. 6M]MCA1280102.1 ABC transporter substrate-binding protein [Saccharopolyspora sp. 7B]
MSAARPLGRSTTRRGLLAAAGSAALLATAGCGLLGGSRVSGANDKVEQATIRVGTLPTTEYAPLALAVRRGYFQHEGLDVQIIPATDGSAALSSLIGGDYDVALSSYVPLLAAHARGAADLRIVADSGAAAPGTAVVVVPADSPVRDPAELAGKVIGVSAIGTVSELLVKAGLSTRGVAGRDVRLVPMSFPNMPAALAQGRLDAALLTEPFITVATREGSARTLFDAAVGPAERLPLSGYGATARFVRDNPRTLAAFQRGLTRATLESRDRRVVEPLLPEIARISPEVAAETKLVDFHTVPDGAQVQRVADLMHRFGFLDRPLDAGTMIAAHP